MAKELIRQQTETRHHPGTCQSEITNTMSPTCLPLPTSKDTYATAM